MTECVPADTAPDAVIRRLQAMAGPAVESTGADGEAFEPTGPVLANWAIKAAGLLEELGASPLCPLLVVAPGGRLHWRALCFALGAWTLNAPVVFADPESAESPESPYLALVPEGCEDAPAGEAADEVLVYPEAPLALAVSVDPGFTDAASAVRSHPDQRFLPRITELSCATPGAQLWTLPTGRAAVPSAGARFGTPRTEAELAELLAGLGSVKIGLGAP